MVKRTIWYVDTGGAVYFWQMIANAWDTGWHQGEMGGAEAISVREQGDVWCLNTRGEVWRSQQSEIGPYQWKQVVEIGPDDVGDIYSGGTYTVKSGDNLWAIVCNEFGLSDPEDTDAISQLVDRIVADNRSQKPSPDAQFDSSGRCAHTSRVWIDANFFCDCLQRLRSPHSH